MAYVLKIKYENNFRRLSVQRYDIQWGYFKFDQLESRIRELFQLPALAPLAVTYTDVENDVVIMGNDEDLKDALVVQALNPLRVHATLLKSKSGDTAEPLKAVDHVDEFADYLRRTLSSAPETVGVAVKEAFDIYSAQAAVRNGTVTLAAATAAIGTAAADAAIQAAALQAYNVARGVEQGPACDRNYSAGLSQAFGGPHSFFGGPSMFEGADQPYPKAVPFGGPSTTSFGGPFMFEGGNQPHRGAVPFGEPSATFFGGSSMCEGANPENDSSPNVHHGVTCDICGVTPIVGDRWKSKEKFDYDLCGSCFKMSGNEEEYSKIDEPKFRPRQMVRSQMGHIPHHMKLPPPQEGLRGHFPHGGRRFGMRGPFGSAGRHPWSPTTGSCRGEEKLYGRFVCDVTVFDGTEVAPGTRFVKIWRLRNSGLSPWPVHTSLAFVGGDDIGHVAVVPLEIPEQGLAPEAEIEASVDMVAPEKPGRYVSHWRLASPTGPKFGQRLSVVIQVVPKTTLDGITTELVPVGDDAPTQELESDTGTSSQTPAEVLAEIKELSQKDIPSPVSVPELKSGAATSSRTPAEMLAAMKKFAQKRSSSPVSVLELESGAGTSLKTPAEMVAVMKEFAQKRSSSPVSVPELESGAGTSSQTPAEVLAVIEKLKEIGQKRTPSPVSVPELEPGAGTSSRTPAEVFAVKLTELAEKHIPSPVSVPVDWPEVEYKGTESVTLAAAAELGVEEKTAVSNISEAPPAMDPVLEVTQKQGPIAYPVVDTAATSEPVEKEALLTTKALLSKLEVMGFTDSKLNAELLEKNGCDLRKTLDDLCAAEEWDPILEELEEMGFYDTDTNRRLMFKNNGSVKSVVKELLQMYRDIQAKREKVE